MNAARLAVSLALTVLLAGGYAASQWAALTGQAVDYAKRVDVPTIQALALVLLVAVVALAFIPERTDEAKP